MSLVTRVSVAFLVALALALGGFSACLYYLAGLRLRLALDQELEATLDRFPDRPEVESGRVTWAIYDETGRRIESAPGAGRPMILDGRDLGPLAVDVATTIAGTRRPAMAGARAADRRRTPPRRAARGPGRRTSPRAARPRRAQGGRPRPRPPAPCAGRVGLARAGGGRDPIAGGHPAAALAGPLGAGRGDRPPFRPTRARPADSDGRGGPRTCPSTTAGCPARAHATNWTNSPAVSTGSSTACTWRWSGRDSSPARRRTSFALRWPP